VGAAGQPPQAFRQMATRDRGQAGGLDITSQEGV